MAKPNFQFEKRKKELERKRKNEEKLQRKQARQADPPEETALDAVERYRMADPFADEGLPIELIRATVDPMAERGQRLRQASQREGIVDP